MMLALRPSPARTFARPLRVARTMTTTAAGSAPERFLADKAAPFCSLNVAPSFALLTAHEKAYAHALRAASWARARVILGQSTPHAARLYDPLVLLFSDADGKFADVHALREKAAVDADEWEALLRYTSQVFSNLSNCKSFGATKFITRASPASFEALVHASANVARAQPFWAELKQHIYAAAPETALLIGKPADGHVLAYYLGAPPSAAEVAAVQAAAERAGINVLNTRVRKDGPGRLALLFAAVDARAGPTLALDGDRLRGAELVVEYGDFAAELARAVQHLEDAKAHAANAHQRAMLEGYIKSFRTGDIGVI